MTQRKKQTQENWNSTCFLSHFHKQKLDINNNKTNRKVTEIKQLNTAWKNESRQKEMKDFPEQNENEYTTYSNLFGTMKVVLSDKFMRLSTSMKILGVIPY